MVRLQLLIYKAYSANNKSRARKIDILCRLIWNTYTNLITLELGFLCFLFGLIKYHFFCVLDAFKVVGKYVEAAFFPSKEKYAASM